MPPALATATKPATRAFGRFELRRVLGEGAQASVWLGFDQRLEREVAVKLMHAGAVADPVAVGEWLREARSVSRLTHPNIVPVFEADVLGGQPYLVFEYVPGSTLAQLVKSRGALPTHEAVALMLGVLDALQAAHAAGVVHRDLKPSNVLVASGGRARVMDFGIAGRLHERGDEIVGTPGYMSPEAVGGGAPTAAMDLFSVGLMLAELLGGSKLIAERDPLRAMHRAANEDLQLPATLAAALDDRLREVLRRALERVPERRWQSAAELRRALQDWIAPAPIEVGSVAGTGGGANGAAPASGTLEFLLRRMRHKTDFPALSQSVLRIQQVASSETQSVSALAGEILKDVALTNKLLRLVNSATYSHLDGGISTVSRAVVLVGFANVRNMALSLTLLEHMQDKAQAAQLREEFLRSLLAGTLASELAEGGPGGEEAYLGALFQNLGRLLTEFYFPEEARQVRGLVAASKAAGEAVPSEASASARVLGVDFETLGLGIARVWGLPAGLQGCLRVPHGAPPARPPTDSDERIRWLAYAANEVADALLLAEPMDAGAAVAAVARRVARAIGVTPARIEAATARAQQRLSQAMDAMSLQVPRHSPAERLLAPAAAITGAPASAARDATTATAAATQAGFTTQPMPLDLPLSLRGTAPPQPAAGDACAVLTAGIQDVTNTLVEHFKLNDVLRMILETMFRALAFRRVVFCLRDVKSGALTGRFGFGDGVEAVAAAFKVPLRGGADLFSAACVKGADIFIEDASSASIAGRLPAWYRQGVDAPSFLLLPIALNGVPLALIYADRERAGAAGLGQRELSLLRTLRNQAVMAFKQLT